MRFASFTLALQSCIRKVLHVQDNHRLWLFWSFHAMELAASGAVTKSLIMVNLDVHTSFVLHAAAYEHASTCTLVGMEAEVTQKTHKQANKYRFKSIHVRVRICVDTFIYVYVYAHTHMHFTCTFTYLQACMHACMPTYIHTYMRACVRACVHRYVRTYVRTYTHTHTHTRTRIQDALPGVRSSR